MYTFEGDKEHILQDIRGIYVGASFQIQKNIQISKAKYQMYFGMSNDALKATSCGYYLILKKKTPMQGKNECSPFPEVSLFLRFSPVLLEPV
jgi:hypothetical protein